MEETVFFGKITASVTHELQNMLAIIRESSGLMEDLIACNNNQSDPLGEKLEKAIATIDRQVEKGSGLLFNLNQFSHSPDNTKYQVDLDEVITRMVALSTRFATLRKVSLKHEASATPTFLTTNAVQLQMSLFYTFDLCLDLMHPGETLVIRQNRLNDDAVVEFSRAAKSGKGFSEKELTESSKWQYLNWILKTIGGSAKPDTSGKNLTLHLQTI